ncbi:hypothetical protein TEQG_08751 [Trichophyton equinum CBS 127.97]|uniref:Uncharacterized protein n=1 Tax=Trichophyton equinum (strain ATCC MYA-4606 / CBS 127.97) TaxID=559882 RepID=F2PZJ3_TRIEC|nr:hypothetical protein TEQG_08751 [Trichophyton equinum CBS 127.97]
MGCVLSCSCLRSHGEQAQPHKYEIGRPTCPSTTVDISLLNLQPIHPEDPNNASRPALIMPMQHSLDMELITAAARYADENRSRVS